MSLSSNADQVCSQTNQQQEQHITVQVNAPNGWTAAQWNYFVDNYNGEITPQIVQAGPNQAQLLILQEHNTC